MGKGGGGIRGQGQAFAFNSATLVKQWLHSRRTSALPLTMEECVFIPQCTNNNPQNILLDKCVGNIKQVSVCLEPNEITGYPKDGKTTF